MELFAYNPVGQPDELLLWVGVLGVVMPPAPHFQIHGEVVRPVAITVPFEPLGDEVLDECGHPLNYRAIFSFQWPDTAERFAIAVTVGERTVSLTSKRPPAGLPAKNERSFNVLLTSCYYQPNDRAQSLAQLTNAIKPAPDFTLLAGDQVYLDLPSQQNLPRDKSALARALGKKYQYNWFCDALDQPGLADVLANGPVLCIPDDHEFWNNFPLFQVQLINTHRVCDRDNWREAALRLYERYQMSPAQQHGFYRWDLAPLSMLFLDGRTCRDSVGVAMFNCATHAAIEQWKNDLLLRKKNNQPAVGLLSSGQALVIEKPGLWDRHIADMEMANYGDFSLIKHVLNTLLAAEIPVIYITGDVHWGRILEGKNHRGKKLFYEIIASPSRLIDTLGSDQKNMIKNTLRYVWTEPLPFPKHPEAPQELPVFKLANLELQTLHRQRGDHVALLRFNAVPGGVEFYVDYVCTDPDDKKQRAYSSSQGPFKLLSQ